MPKLIPMKYLLKPARQSGRNFKMKLLPKELKRSLHNVTTIKKSNKYGTFVTLDSRPTFRFIRRAEERINQFIQKGFSL